VLAATIQRTRNPRAKQARATGRPPTWGSQRCRRAAYEERRAAARGAIAIKLVERESPNHDISECVARTQRSPAACRRVLAALTDLAAAQELQYDPKWQSTLRAIAGLTDALSTSRQHCQARFAATHARRHADEQARDRTQPAG
jgi:hypothetical protein